jgi:hypothetical protein
VLVEAPDDWELVLTVSISLLSRDELGLEC